MPKFSDYDQRNYERRHSLAQSSVRLVIICSSLPPEQISTILDLQPTSGYRPGDKLIGSPTDEICQVTIWSLSSVDFVKAGEMSQHLDWMKAQLSAKSTAFKHLNAQKSKIRLECLTHEFIPSSMLDIKPDFLLQLGQSGISLRIASIFHTDERDSKGYDRD